MSTDPCPMASLVEAKRDGRLSEREAASVDRHVAACASCAALSTDLDRLGELLRVRPLTPLERQRGRLALLRRAARPQSPARTRRGPALVVLAVALGVALSVVRRAPGPPTVASHMPPIPRPTMPRLETTVTPEGTAAFARNTTGGIEIVTLESGALTIAVRKLDTTERFIVRTSDAEVEVRGTMFRVEAEHDQLQSVEVTEGKVEVRFRGSTWLVAQGRRWSRPADGVVEPAPVNLAPVRGGRAATTAQPRASAEATTTAPEASSDTLREGVHLADRGDYEGAAKRLSDFCEAHPHDERAEDAAFLLAVSLQRAGRIAEARAAARRYLMRYPNGYRRTEAEAIASTP